MSSILPGIRYLFIPACLFIIFSGVCWLYIQHQRVIYLKQHNTYLKKESERLNLRLNQLKVHSTTLATAVSKQQQSQKQLEENSDALRKKIQHKLVNDRCADEPVPDDIISLQREAINNNFSGFSSARESVSTVSSAAF